MKPNQRGFSWRPVRIGLIIGLLLGAAVSLFLFMWSVHVPFGTNLLVAPAMAGIVGASIGFVAEAIASLIRRDTTSPHE